MADKEIKTIQTSKGNLNYYRDWECEGGIVMLNAQTVKRYREIKSLHPDTSKYAVFFAFGKDQFREGYKALVNSGKIKEGDKVVRGLAGLYGTRQAIEEFYSFYENRDKAIPEECDPQEVYFYEYNNHESMIAWDGDLEAIKIIIDTYGADVARNIVRYNASMSIENLIRKPIRMEGLYFVHNHQRMQPKTIWFSSVESDISTKGKCHCMYNNTLHTVFTSENTVYYNLELSGLSAYYDGKEISNFYKE